MTCHSRLSLLLIKGVSAAVVRRQRIDGFMLQRLSGVPEQGRDCSPLDIVLAVTYVQYIATCMGQQVVKVLESKRIATRKNNMGFPVKVRGTCLDLRAALPAATQSLLVAALR